MKANEISLKTYAAAAMLLDIDNVDANSLKNVLTAMQDQEWISVSEAAKILKVNRRYIAHLIKANVFRSARVGKRFLVSQSSLREWLADGGGTLIAYSRDNKGNKES